LYNFTSDNENNDDEQYLSNLELDREEQKLLEKSITNYEKESDGRGVYDMDAGITRQTLQTSNRVLYGSIPGGDSDQFDRIANFDKFKEELQRANEHIHSGNPGSDGRNMQQIFADSKLNNTSKALEFS